MDVNSTTNPYWISSKIMAQKFIFLVRIPPKKMGKLNAPYELSTTSFIPILSKHLFHLGLGMKRYLYLLTRSTSFRRPPLILRPHLKLSLQFLLPMTIFAYLGFFSTPISLPFLLTSYLIDLPLVYILAHQSIIVVIKALISSLKNLLSLVMSHLIKLTFHTLNLIPPLPPKTMTPSFMKIHPLLFQYISLPPP